MTRFEIDTEVANPELILDLSSCVRLSYKARLIKAIRKIIFGLS